jgi:two-component system sensor histidine kinase/response regulator
MVLDPCPFMLDKVLGDISIILSTYVANKPVEVLFDIASDVQQEMVGDAMRLQQVILNLGSNAIKFTERGSVVIKIEALQKSVTAITLKISVRDTGIGIAPENHARIFSGFTQAEASTTRRFGGTGLGIAISQHLVNLMGGQLELISALGEGSCFFFSITVPFANVDHTNTPTDIATAKSVGGSVLVVDDNPIALDIIAQLCESLGWQADRASSGQQALDLIKQCAERGNNYRAVFVDWQMPDMDGWQTISAIHQIDDKHLIPIVVIVTAHDREMLDQRSKAEQALIDGYLVKPVTATMLINAVEDARSLTAGNAASKDSAPNTELRLKAMKILLVEDNLNNQQIAYELLVAEGAIVEVVNNGEEAVARLAKAAAFDVVLMDLQMPVMDGLTATQHIRKALGLMDLPIVAMTANAMQSDIDTCIQAGMNDHVGKPFDLNNLINVVRLRTGWEASQPTKPVATPANAPYEQAATLAKVDIKSALTRLGGKQQLYVRMFPLFLTTLKELPAKLLSCLESQDYVQASQQLHSLKGLAGTMGAMDLAAQAGSVEKQLAGDITAATARLQVLNINAVISEMLPNLDAFLRALQPPEVTLEASSNATTEATAGGICTLNTSALLAALNSLLNQLTNSDMAATNAAELLEKNFGAVLGERLEPLKAAMGNLDFEWAVDCVLILLAYIQSDKDTQHD